MNLLEFCVENTDGLPEKVNLKNMKEIERIKYDLPFTIRINGNVYFYDEYFTILDFLFTAMCWQKNCENKELLYNSPDTDDNPLISFKCIGQAWYIESPWEKFACDKFLTKNDLFNAINELKRICHIIGF